MVQFQAGLRSVVLSHSIGVAQLGQIANRSTSSEKSHTSSRRGASSFAAALSLRCRSISDLPPFPNLLCL